MQEAIALHTVSMIGGSPWKLIQV